MELYITETLHLATYLFATNTHEHIEQTIKCVCPRKSSLKYTYSGSWCLSWQYVFSDQRSDRQTKCVKLTLTEQQILRQVIVCKNKSLVHFAVLSSVQKVCARLWSCKYGFGFAFNKNTWALYFSCSRKVPHEIFSFFISHSISWTVASSIYMRPFLTSGSHVHELQLKRVG